jgi:hypothetical protein
VDRKVISMAEYNGKIASIARMGLPVQVALIMMLEEAAKYKITQPKNRKSTRAINKKKVAKEDCMKLKAKSMQRGKK